METAVKTQRLGPIELAPGISQFNVMTKLYACFIGVAMFSGISFLQGYILTEHLHIPRGQQGTLTGDITFVAEITTILFFTPFGVLADRIGRRPIYILGILLIGLGYGLYPFAPSAGWLIVFRFIMSIGVAAAAGMLATMTNDYPQENSRGKLIGLTSMANILGTMFVAGVIGRIPIVLTARDVDPVTAGQVMFLFATALCVVTAVVAQLGLKEGTPVAKKDQPSVKVLLMSGLRNGKNPRIALSYAAAFAARSDLVIKGAFLALWAIQDGARLGMSPAAAMARYGIMIIIMQLVSVVAAPFFGWYMDTVNRITATMVALVFAIVGYLSMYIITSPLDFAMLPWFIIISLGSGFMLKSSLGMIGQEAPVKERGSVIAMNSTFGAIGILILMLIGGRLFDSWGPWAPFVIAGFYQIFLLAAAMVIRIVAPGPIVVNQKNWGAILTGRSTTSEKTKTRSPAE